jgi:hypothetical protein
MGKSLLTLETLHPDRDFITINEQPYYLRGEGELSLMEIARIRALSKKVIERGMSIDSTEQDMAEIEAFANDVLGIIVLEFPPEVRDKLSTLQKFSIVQAFTTVASSKRAGSAAGERKEEGQPTTDGSSPGSSDSTSTDQSLPG